MESGWWGGDFLEGVVGEGFSEEVTSEQSPEKE